MPEYKAQTIAQNVATRPTLYFYTVTTPERLKTGVLTFVRAAQQVSYWGTVRGHWVKPNTEILLKIVTLVRIASKRSFTGKKEYPLSSSNSQKMKKKT